MDGMGYDLFGKVSDANDFMVPSQRHGALVLAMPMRRCAPPSGVPLRVEGSAVSQGGPPCRSKAESHASICLDDFFVLQTSNC